MPIVSVIMPVYNAADFVSESVATLTSQTLADIEILCVDDCSTDDSLEVLKGLAANDARIRILQTPANSGPGIARNLAIDAAEGEFIAFLDSDDAAEPDMLEKAVARARQTGADIVVFDAFILDNPTKSERRAYAVNGSLFGEADTITWRDIPDRIFQLAENWPWNKLVSASLVREHGIRFQDIHRTEDLLFTCRALMCANAIAYAEEKPLVHYRVERPASSINTKDAFALDFFYAFAELKKELESAGTYNAVRRSFDCWAAASTCYNLTTLRSAQSFTEAFSFMASKGLSILGLDTALELAAEYAQDAHGAEAGADREPYFFHPVWEPAVRAIAAGNVPEFFLTILRDRTTWEEQLQQEAARRTKELDGAWQELKDANEEIWAQRGRGDDLERIIENLDKDLAAARNERDAILGSAEYRLGRALGRVPRAIQRRVRRS